MGDVGYQLLAKNLPGLTTLYVGNTLSNSAVRSLIQLRQLTELWIGNYILTNTGGNNIDD